MANPNPSPSTRFQKGTSGNPGGKTGEQLKIEREAAEMAARLRHQMLSSLAGKIEEGMDAAEMIDPANLKLIKDSEDRAHGTPQQSMDMTTKGEPMPFGGGMLVPLEDNDD